MANYAPQVDKSHYGAKYRSLDRWLSYFYQLAHIQSLHPATLLEVGPGEGIVTDALRKGGIRVTTCDIAADLSPDVVASVTSLPFKDQEFDAVLASEILEHIKYEDVPQALCELARVSSKHVVVSLPHPGWVFAVSLKVPLLPHTRVWFQIPFFWKTHRFNGEHYWELGKRGFPVSRFISLAREAGLELAKTVKYADDPVHRFFVFSVRS